MKFLVIKKQTIKNILIVLLTFVLAFSILTISKNVFATTTEKINYTIVLDAGHGGIDGGSEGVLTGVKESELNLKVTKKLEKLLNTFGFNVVLTRTNADGLYSQFATNKKQDDMKKRKEIIQKSKPNMVVSIHMNSFPNKHERGAQVFYQVGEETSKQLAQTIQNEMIKNLVEAREFCNHSDLYILQCTKNPSVVVEGGFLSNPEEEALLITDEYQAKLAYSVFCGILKFFEKQNAA